MTPLLTAKTHNEFYSDWLATKPKERFRDFMARTWGEHLDAYERLGFVCIDVSHREKIPVRGTKWREKALVTLKSVPQFEFQGKMYGPFEQGKPVPEMEMPEAMVKQLLKEGVLKDVNQPSYDELKRDALRGDNIALNAGDSNVVVLDYDSKYLTPKLERLLVETPSITTPKGFAILTRPPADGPLFDELKARYPPFDAPRGEGKYELLPISESCGVKGHGTKVDGKEFDCPHDYRIRSWVLGLDSLSLPIRPFRDTAEMMLG